MTCESGPRDGSKSSPTKRQRIDSDCVERKEATELDSREAELQLALASKDRLIRELCHRSMNNLQAASSLLTLRGTGLPAGPAREILEECTQSLRAMALVQDSLYRSEKPMQVHVAAYLTELSAQLHRALDPSQNVTYALDMHEVDVESEQGTLWGLILVELLTNAHKHAFPSDGRGRVQVRLVASGGAIAQMEVADTGVGLSRGQTSFTEGTGLALVRGLASQLHAAVDMTFAAGTQVTVTVAPRVAGPSIPR